MDSIMDLSYVITPFFAWLVTGIAKFVINSVQEKRLAFDLIGYGGMPSNHSSIVTSVVVIIALKEGLQHPALVVALAFAFIVLLDANSLRNQVGKQAKMINELAKQNAEVDKIDKLRERIGHSRFEILAGVVTGTVSAYVVYIVFNQWLS